MEIRQLNYLLAIYEEGSLTRAARRLNVVQPALSQQILKLEQEIGQPLFTRTPKGMIPTNAGVEAYQLFSGIVRSMEDALRTLSGENDRVSGVVSLGVVGSVSNNALGEILQKFIAKHPEVQLKVTGGYTAELRQQLRMSNVDFVIINVPPMMQDPRFVDIIEEDLCLIAAHNTAVPFEGSVSLQDISELQLVIPSQRHGLRMIIDRAANELGVILTPTTEFDEIKLIEDFVKTTGFFTVLPPIAVSTALRRGNLKAYSIRSPFSRRLVYETDPSRSLSLAAQLLIEEIREDMIESYYSMETLLNT